MSNSAVSLQASVLVVLAAGSATGQSTTLVSVSSSGTHANNSSFAPSISADGRFVVFETFATNLVTPDTNGSRDILVYDRQTGATERVSVDSSGTQGNYSSNRPRVSADGRFVVFESSATNLVPGDTNGRLDIFVRDRQAGTTERVSLDSAGTQGNGDSGGPSLSPDGRFVAFESTASNLVTGDTNGSSDVFLHDRQSGMTERVSVASGATQANGGSMRSSPSADGRFVAFDSLATNLVTGDTNSSLDVFVRDRQTGLTERVSVDTSGLQGNGDSGWALISADGRFVAFDSIATNLVTGDVNPSWDELLRDRQSGTTSRIDVDAAGVQGIGECFLSSISADGRFVAYHSFAANLVASDTNGFSDAFVRDCWTGLTERVSVDSGGAQGNGDSYHPTSSDDGRFVAFSSSATNLVVGDGHGYHDIFVRDRGTGGPGTDICQAGSGGVIACPCTNPPAYSGRGCDNSLGTGGARLASSGSASLSADSLVFVTLAERPTATSVVLQGDAGIASGLAFGQGVSCAGGLLKRLYVKPAMGGSITAPGPGDPTISARSAALGDPIGAGTSRWYAVYYRDPIILGGCPASNTFNITQTQLVNWGA